MTGFVARLRASFRLAGRYDELIDLVRSIEQFASSLGGSPKRVECSPRDPFELLCSARDQLERAIAEARATPARPDLERFRGESKPAQRPAPPVPGLSPREPARQKAAAERMEPGPPQRVTDLIEVSDMLLMAANSSALHGRETFELLHGRLGGVLEREGIRVIDREDARYDPIDQEIVEVRPTVDVSRDGVVCATVRPGYAFGDRILRTQQVVVHQHSESAGNAG